MYSIRHMNALKLYEDLKDVNLVAQALNTSPEIVKSNYLNYSDEWARNRFKVLGYDKRKLPQTSMKYKTRFLQKVKTFNEVLNEVFQKMYIFCY